VGQLHRQRREGAQAAAGRDRERASTCRSAWWPAVNGDLAKVSLSAKLVDGLKTRDEIRPDDQARRARRSKARASARSAFHDYLARVHPPKLTGDAVGVIVAQGEITDGTPVPARSAAIRPPS
jgi:hypothetical protein